MDDGRSRLVYSGDVVPDSSVFVMDSIPECDLLILDASYGADPVAGATRAKAIAAWVDEHAAGCLLPTPLSGRSLELMAGLSGPFAVHAAMRSALQAQIDASRALLPGMSELLHRRLETPATGATAIRFRPVRYSLTTEWARLVRLRVFCRRRTPPTFPFC